MFRDDPEYMRSFNRVLQTVPGEEYARMAVEEGLRLWRETEAQKESSKVLQEKCRILYVLAHIRKTREESLQIVELLLLKLDDLDFKVKYPIQERYYAMLYYTLWRLIKKEIDVKRGSSASSLQLQYTTKLFIYAFGGLSSSLEIVSKIASLILEVYQKQYEATSLGGLLTQDRRFFFTNLFSKLISHPSQSLSLSKHQLAILRTLKSHAPELLRDPRVLYDLT
jgi:hypothetical protein